MKHVPEAFVTSAYFCLFKTLWNVFHTKFILCDTEYGILLSLDEKNNNKKNIQTGNILYQFLKLSICKKLRFRYLLKKKKFIAVTLR